MWKFRDLGKKKKNPRNSEIWGFRNWATQRSGDSEIWAIQESCQFRNPKKIGDLGKSEIRGSQKSKEDRSPRKSEIQKIRESGEVQGSGNSGIQRVLGI